VSRLKPTSDDRFVRPPHASEDSVVSIFRVPPEQAGQRLDVFLQSELRRTSRTRTQEIIRLSAHDADGRAMRPGQRVLAEQRVLLWRAPWDEMPVPTDVPILYEDPHLFAVDKPAGLPVHPTARYHKNTLINVLKRARPGAFVSLGHRLDRETSGVMLISKSPECDRALKRDLENRQNIDKRYLALTWNVPSDPEGGTRTRFRFEQSVELDPESTLGVKMRLGKSERALRAATRFEIIERASRGERRYAKVLCDLETGRQHQIRIHLATLGAPIVGDKLYGPDERLFARGADGELTADDLVLLELPRHALHAARISLPHPITRAPLVVEAPVPADVAAFWSALTLEGSSSAPDPAPERERERD
jgi:23S rRNA pseudouridine1911/1915/1917 synthase